MVKFWIQLIPAYQDLSPALTPQSKLPSGEFLASKRCNVSGLSCRYLNPYIKSELIELSTKLYQELWWDKRNCRIFHDHEMQVPESPFETYESFFIQFSFSSVPGPKALKMNKIYYLVVLLKRLIRSEYCIHKKWSRHSWNVSTLQLSLWHTACLNFYFARSESLL